MDKPKKAWLHKSNDNYYTDEQFQQEVAHQPWLLKSYIPFVEQTEVCPIVEVGKEIMEQHKETLLKLRISELEDQLKESQIKYIEARKSGYDEAMEDSKK